jgi:hypothetical protein
MPAFCLDDDESFLLDIFHYPAMPSVAQDRDDTGIPVACSKCNETFKTDSEYMVHYNEAHAGNLN